MSEEIEIKLKIDRKRYTVEDVVKVEEGSMRALYNLIAQSMVGSDGEYMDPDQARAILAKADMESFDILANRFVEELQALPKARRTP